ncbi:MAG: hypothetical protein ABFQ95_06990 [Pseudomonadota bacterium]
MSPKNEEGLRENLNAGGGVTSDKTDRDIQSIIDSFEERAAIVEFDAGKSILEAERTAYQEAFVNLLSTHYDDAMVECQGQDWLQKRIDVIQTWLKQHLPLTERST